MSLINEKTKIFPTFDDAAAVANRLAAGDPDWTFIAAGNYTDGELNGFLVRILDEDGEFVSSWTD